jgi:hypothetical protein
LEPSKRTVQRSVASQEARSLLVFDFLRDLKAMKLLDTLPMELGSRLKDGTLNGEKGTWFSTHI